MCCWPRYTMEIKFWLEQGFPCSPFLSHTLIHTYTLVMDWSGCVGIGILLRCLPLSPCAMKLIITIEITYSHSNLDIFSGVGMMTRLYSKWHITPFSPSPSLSFDFYLLSSIGCFILPPFLSLSCTLLLFTSNFLSQYFTFPLIIIFTLLALPLCNYFMWLSQKLPAYFL